ncbi:MAG: hypothetical protein M9964_08630 [Solirubrobacterales bacterium]|nr:hypothetical protein [Thermoleophilales bacterium]MCO5327104.1 hypothetical protein [Solirubrobacterales bacterium]
MTDTPQPREPIFPPEDVAASIADGSLQGRHRTTELDPGIQSDMEEARQRVVAEGASPLTRWIYFSSPSWTWEQLCGREGWLLYDPESERQFQFVMTVMN